MKIINISMTIVIPALTLCLTNEINSVGNNGNNRNEIRKKIITDDEFEIIPTDSSSEAVIYINKDFTKNRAMYSNNITIESLENGEENELCDVNLELAASYDFNYQGKKYKGEIYANPYDSIEFVEAKVDEIINQIYDNTFFSSYNLSTRLQGDFYTDENWLLLNEKKVDFTLTYDNEHFGDFSEWRSVYALQNVRSGTSYFAFINESYITPEKKKTDYRTDDIIYKYNPTLGAKAEVRNYAPKMKSPSAEIGYTISAGAEATDEGGATISSTISTSYSTLVESPKIFDQGNMSKNYVELKFDYLEPFKNSGLFYEYNISQTYQSSSFIIKSDDSNNDIITKNDRTVSIQRDGFWSNRLVHFNIDSKITINR